MHIEKTMACPLILVLDGRACLCGGSTEAGGIGESSEVEGLGLAVEACYKKARLPFHQLQPVQHPASYEKQSLHCISHQLGSCNVLMIARKPLP